MTLTEWKSKIKKRAEVMEERFSSRYKTVLVDGRPFFLGPDGSTLFVLNYMISYGALVIAYAESVEDAEAYRMEDGDLFYVEDLDEESMFQLMIQEIEN